MLGQNPPRPHRSGPSGEVVVHEVHRAAGVFVTRARISFGPGVVVEHEHTRGAGRFLNETRHFRVVAFDDFAIVVEVPHFGGMYAERESFPVQCRRGIEHACILDSYPVRAVGSTAFRCAVAGFGDEGDRALAGVDEIKQFGLHRSHAARSRDIVAAHSVGSTPSFGEQMPFSRETARL